MHPDRKSTGYQILLTALLSLNFGIVLFDRNALSFLMPFIQPDLGLSNTQVGIARERAVADLGARGVRHRRASPTGSDPQGAADPRDTRVLACARSAPGIAASFVMMLGARLLMGVAEGGIMPISQSMIATEVDAASIAGSRWASRRISARTCSGRSWRRCCWSPSRRRSAGGTRSFSPARPGSLDGAADGVAHPDAAVTPQRQRQRSGLSAIAGALREVLAERNVIICALLGVLLVSYLVVCWAFMPLYLTQVRRLRSADDGLAHGHARHLGDDRRRSAIPACRTASAAGR